tara:strand:+ start:348 stop:1511 length:1164 start_codon:yes stop_codon:yes gene_type:complete
MKKYNSIDKKDLRYASKILKSGKLSGFLAGSSNLFYGGKYVKLFENKLQKYFGAKYAITVNSWTSGLVSAIGALNLREGDEVILPTWTMSACLASIIHYKLNPVICDIDENDFTIDVQKIEKLITKKTKAIMAVDIFGAACDYDKIFRITKKYKLKLITDSAQAIGGKYRKKYLSTFSDIGGFSLNRHKHINTGEGGILLTNNKEYAERLYLIRNHAESSLKKNQINKYRKLVGYNFRLGEIESAIGITQLSKLKKIIEKRKKDSEKLYKIIKKYEGIITPSEKYITSSVFYFVPFKIDKKKILTKKKIILDLFKKYNLDIRGSYSSLHNLPIAKTLINKNKCSTADKLNQSTFLYFPICLYKLDAKTINSFSKKFNLVWSKLKFKK